MDCSKWSLRRILRNTWRASREGQTRPFSRLRLDGSDQPPRCSRIVRPCETRSLAVLDPESENRGSTFHAISTLNADRVEVAAAQNITELLASLRGGEKEALAQLFPFVYRELHALAERAMRGERLDHTLQTTALLHEAYLRMVDQSQPSWQNRAHFFAVAAHAMREILIDHARTRKTQKRGGGARREPLLTLAAPEGAEPIDLLALDEALSHFAEKDPRSARIVELRFFAGLTHEEIAEVLGSSLGTVERGWRFAKGWLRRELTREQEPPGDGS